DSVPLLRVPQTLGWAEPDLFDTPGSRSLIVIFKIVLITPLVHIIVSAYQFAEANLLTESDVAHARRRRMGRPGGSDADDVSIVWVGLLVTSAVTLLVLHYVLDPSWFFNQWLDQQLPNPWLHWLRKVPEWIVVVALLAIGVVVFGILRDESTIELRSLAGVI